MSSSSCNPSDEKLDTSHFQETDEYYLITQAKYKSRSSFDPQPSLSFLDEDGNPTPLHVMLRKDFQRSGWEGPWVPSVHRQKITIRTRLEAANQVFPAKVEPQVNVRTDTTQKPYSQLQIGKIIAHVLQSSDHLKEFCAVVGCGFEDITIYEIQHVAKASWQPVLGVKVQNPPVVPT